jgi:hypothetical protein
MQYTVKNGIEILERTPRVIDSLLRNLPDEWVFQNEGGETWSPYDVLGHLIHGERTDWIARLEIILSDAMEKKFTPFDRFAQFTESKGKSLGQLLDEFNALRQENVRVLKSKVIRTDDFQKTALHPSLGIVNLNNLLSTWVVHDLNHIAQISRVLAHQYSDQVGPWKEYLRILYPAR